MLRDTSIWAKTMPQKTNDLPSSPFARVIQIVRNKLPDLAFNILPTPVQNRLRPRHELSRPLGRTAYLDGLRGHCALGVCLLHMMLGFFPNCDYAFNGQDGRNYVFQLPFLRLLYSGQVPIFFIISGYVLSIGPIRKIRSQSFNLLQHDLCSKIFRRIFRLYLPSIAATFIPMIMLYLGLFPSVVKLDENMPYKTYEMRTPEATLAAQLLSWLKTVPGLFWPFDWLDHLQRSPYANQLWSIPVELRCAMVLFLVHTSLGRFTPAIRMSFIGILSSFMLTFESWEKFLFLAGAVLAELDIIHEERATNQVSLLAILKEGGSEQLTNGTGPVLSVTTLVISLWLLSVPAADIWNAWSFAILEKYAPPTYTEFYRFWDSVGTVSLLWSIMGLPSVQRIYTRPIFLYLGKISFSLYLTHTMALKAFMYPMMPWIWRITGYETDLSYGVGVAIGGSITVVLALWMADLFQRFVELPSTEFANWLEQQCSVDVKENGGEEKY